MRTADVAIIGGGVTGCSIAYHLAIAGLTNLAVFERGHLAGGATGICPGGIRQQFAGEADCVFARRSLRFYERINDTLAPEAPFFFERSGYLFLADSAALLEQFRRNVTMQNRLGVPSRIVTPDELRARLPRLRLDGVLGGAFCDEDGFLEDCDGVTNLLAARAREQGARVLYEDVADLRRDGPAWRLVTAAGAFAAAHVVLAAGADSVALAAGAGIPLPIVAERRRLAYTVPYERGVMPPLVVALERGVAGKQLTNGVLYLGWLGEMESADDLTFIERTMAAAATLLPDLSELPVRRVVSGPYDNTPDRRPILGPAPGVDGLHLAVGFSGHGFMIAPAVGEAVAAGILGKATDLPIDAFSLERFATAAGHEGLVI